MARSRTLLLPLLALAALAAPASAGASAAGVGEDGQLWVAGLDTEGNEITVSFAPQEGRFLVVDNAGIQPAGPECTAMGPGSVACDDPGRRVGLIYGVLGDGNDVLRIDADGPDAVPAGVRALIDGGPGNDVLLGGLGRDRLLGGPDGDTIAGGEGDDLLKGGEGDDGVIGFAGNDRIYGGPGGDALFGFGGKDRVVGGPGRNTLMGGNGADRVLGGAARDVLFGGKGRDRLFAGAGPDVIRARDRRRDPRIDCGPGSNERVFVDRFDPRPKRC
jgi:hypothetical protein